MGHRNWSHKFNWLKSKIEPIADKCRHIFENFGRPLLLIRWPFRGPFGAYAVCLCEEGSRLLRSNYPIIIIVKAICSAPNMIESYSSDRNIQYTTIYSLFFFFAHRPFAFIARSASSNFDFRFCIYCSSVLGQTIVEILFFNVFISRSAFVLKTVPDFVRSIFVVV